VYILQKIVNKFFKQDQQIENLGKNVYFRLIKAATAGLILNIIFGTSFYFVESSVQPDLTYLDSIWWAMVTMTTVGYGDIYAHSFIGRFFISYPCMLVGIGIIGYLIGVLAEAMVERMARYRRGDMSIKLSGHIILCNCPSIKKIVNLVKEIRDSSDFQDKEIVLITETFDEIPEVLSKLNVKFVKGSSAEENILKKAGFEKCAGVFVLGKSGDNQDTDVYTLAIASLVDMLKTELNCNPKVIVEVTNQKSTKLMNHAGVQGIVESEGITDRLMVQEFLYPGVHDIIQQVISNSVGSQFYIFNTKLFGRKLKEIQMAVLQHPEDLQVIGVINNGKQLINPSKQYEICDGDKLILLAKSKADFEGIEKDILNI